ncbi:MAG: hypothetical protein OEM58_10495 [Nitrospirota bacterium]|nr:hypothetical protein [Nitrospirota bacterium]
MRYRFIDEQKKAWPIILMCGVLGASRSGYCHWTVRGQSRRARLNNALNRRIRFTRASSRFSRANSSSLATLCQ